MILLSVIIPTYNRSNILQECILKLSEQTLSPLEYEILVVDDGSTDCTCDMISNLTTQITPKLRYFRQHNMGPATARNKGVKEAKGKILLFFGDDILAESNLLKKHLDMHEKYFNPQEAVLGLINWDSRLHITSLMRYVNQGPQFAYHKIRDIHNAGYPYFYSSNISLKGEFLLGNGLFDEEFKKAACEDTEMGFRLEQKGLRIHFCVDAVAYHHHAITLDDFISRAMLVGRETNLLQKKHPGKFNRKNRKFTRLIIGVFLPLLKSIARKTSTRLWGNDLIYRALFLYYFHQGLRQPPKGNG